MKPWVTVKINNHCDQVIGVQPTPEMDGAIEMWWEEVNGSHNSGILYISKEELPIIIEHLQEMMDYVSKK